MYVCVRLSHMHKFQSCILLLLLCIPYYHYSLGRQGDTLLVIRLLMGCWASLLPAGTSSSSREERRSRPRAARPPASAGPLAPRGPGPPAPRGPGPPAEGPEPARRGAWGRPPPLWGPGPFAEGPAGKRGGVGEGG